MRLMRMGREQGVLLSSKENTFVKNGKRSFVSIDVVCKKYTMMFVNEFNPPDQKVIITDTTNKLQVEKKSSSTRLFTIFTKSKSSDRATVDIEKSAENHVIVVEAPGEEKTSPISKVTKPKATKNKEVLGALNVIESSKLTKDKPREKRKRIVAEDNDISAENIPLDAVLPKLQFGINRDICPKKRKRLRSLLSPKSPSPSQFFPEKKQGNFFVHHGSGGF